MFCTCAERVLALFIGMTALFASPDTPTILLNAKLRSFLLRIFLHVVEVHRVQVRNSPVKAQTGELCAGALLVLHEVGNGNAVPVMGYMACRGWASGGRRYPARGPRALCVAGRDFLLAAVPPTTVNHASRLYS